MIFSGEIPYRVLKIASVNDRIWCELIVSMNNRAAAFSLLTLINAMRHRCLHRDSFRTVFHSTPHSLNSHSWNVQQRDIYELFNSAAQLNFDITLNLHNSPENVTVYPRSEAQVEAAHLSQVNSIAMREEQCVASIWRALDEDACDLVASRCPRVVCFNRLLIALTVGPLGFVVEIELKLWFCFVACYQRVSGLGREECQFCSYPSGARWTTEETTKLAKAGKSNRHRLWARRDIAKSERKRRERNKYMKWMNWILCYFGMKTTSQQRNVFWGERTSGNEVMGGDGCREEANQEENLQGSSAFSRSHWATLWCVKLFGVAQRRMTRTKGKFLEKHKEWRKLFFFASRRNFLLCSTSGISNLETLCK